MQNFCCQGSTDPKGIPTAEGTEPAASSANDDAPFSHTHHLANQRRAWRGGWEIFAFLLSAARHLNVFVALVNNIHFIVIMSDLANDIDDPTCVEERVEEREVSVKPKKRKGDPSLWKKKVAKACRDNGHAYVSAYTNQHVAARVVGPPCGCPLKCYNIVGAENVNMINQEYWKLGSHNCQSSYIVTRVVNREIKRRYVTHESKRKCQREYSVLVNGQKVIVCMVAFLNMHAISETRVRNALKKVGVTGTPPADKRGTNPNSRANKIPDEVLQHVHDHISGLPTCTSHYSRAKSKDKVYLPPGSSHRTLYKDFLKFVEERGVTGKEIAPAWKYSEIFSTYNIGVEPPKSDSCNFCDENRIQELKASKENNVERKRELQIQRQVHLKKAQVAHSIKKVYAIDDDPSLVAIAIDLQATLPTPRISTSVQYYKRKMWTYNFGIHALKTKKAHLYVWNEAVARRGSAEIGSCLLHYVNNVIPRDVNKLIIFSDNCSGQNKNINLSLLLLRLVQSGRFSQVKQYFFISGHSFLPCDQDFGNLERVFEGQDIYTTPQYMSIMKEARDTNPFNVVEMTCNDFFDIEPLQALCTRGSLARAGFKDGRVFEYNSNYMQGMSIMRSYTIIEPQQVKLQKGRGANYDPAKFDLTSVRLQLKYPNGVPLKPNKLADVKYLSRFVHPDHMAFYDALFESQERLQEQGVEPGDDVDNPDDDFLDY